MESWSARRSTTLSDIAQFPFLTFCENRLKSFSMEDFIDEVQAVHDRAEGKDRPGIFQGRNQHRQAGRETFPQSEYPGELDQEGQRKSGCIQCACHHRRHLGNTVHCHCFRALRSGDDFLSAEQLLRHRDEEGESERVPGGHAKCRNVRRRFSSIPDTRI